MVQQPSTGSGTFVGSEGNAGSSPGLSCALIYCDGKLAWVPPEQPKKLLHDFGGRAIRQAGVKENSKFVVDGLRALVD
ncbi:hypothetical protein KQI84_05815 [bacterium]|nr:hypothetical protein [bacterium]